MNLRTEFWFIGSNYVQNCKKWRNYINLVNLWIDRSDNVSFLSVISEFTQDVTDTQMGHVAPVILPEMYKIFLHADVSLDGNIYSISKCFFGKINDGKHIKAILSQRCKQQHSVNNAQSNLKIEVPIRRWRIAADIYCVQFSHVFRLLESEPDREL